MLYVMYYTIGQIRGKVTLEVPDIKKCPNITEYCNKVTQFTQALLDFNDNFERSGAVVERELVEDER